MSTTKVSDAQAKEAASRSQPEDATAAFGFFRRHQKLIVYTAGIFTLLTFSITGAVMSVSQQWSEDLRLPTIQDHEGRWHRRFDDPEAEELPGPGVRPVGGGAVRQDPREQR
ncbi:MAG: hypothetical protein ACYS5W_19345 [Planctomycetota bacterium]|jgi:hypothetical protein